MPKILITGGAGFIGSNIVDHFLAMGHEVVCLDDLSTGYEHNISHNFDNPNFTFIEGDICSYHTINQAIKSIAVVLNKAALPSVPRSIKDPITTNEVNLVGTLNILDAAKDL
jgi:UDP-N-acetylglucosamine 4-epimerase